MINVQVYFKNSYINSFFDGNIMTDVEMSKQQLYNNIEDSLLDFILTTFKDITGDDIEFDIQFYNHMNENISCAVWIDRKRIPLNLDRIVLSVIEDDCNSWIVEYNEYTIIHNTHDPIITRVYSDGTVKLFTKKLDGARNTILVEQTSIHDKLMLESICKVVIDALNFAM